MDKPLLILVAEDNPVNQELCKVRLEKMGHEVVIANNGLEALGFIQGRHFDLILMDVQMPELDGFGATRKIREWEKQHGSYTPIIAMTARAMRGDQELCYDAGMDGYMAKPFRMEELTQVLRRITNGEPMSNGRVAPAARLPGAYSYALVREEVEENIVREDMEEFLDLFFENARTELDAITAALDAQNLAALQDHAHSIKGILHVFCARRAVRLASDLEQAARQEKVPALQGILQELQGEMEVVFFELERVREELRR